MARDVRPPRLLDPDVDPYPRLPGDRTRRIRFADVGLDLHDDTAGHDAASIVHHDLAKEIRRNLQRGPVIDLPGVGSRFQRHPTPHRSRATARAAASATWGSRSVTIGST